MALVRGYPVISAAASLTLLVLLSAHAWAASSKVLKKTDSLDLRTGIRIDVKEGLDLGGKPGFKLALSGWTPGAGFAVYGLDTEGDSVALVPAEAGRAADAAGRAAVNILYETPGLHPGQWVIEVSGKGTDRAESLSIPAVVHGKHGWRLDFQAARDWDARHPGETPAPPG